MTVLNVQEIWSGRQNEYSGEFRRSDFKEERTLVKVFRVELSLPTQDMDSILTDCQTIGGGFLFQAQFGAPSNYRFPQAGDSHPINPDYGAKTFRIRQPDESSPNIVDIEVAYTLLYNPLNEPAIIEGDYLAWERVVEFAYQPSPLNTPVVNADGTIPIVNSAYSTFDPPPTRMEPYRVLRVTVNLLMSAWDDRAVLNNFVQMTNSVPFVVTFPDGTRTTYETGTVLLETPPKFTTEFRSVVGAGIHYLRTVWEFKIRKIGWFYRIADLGYSTFDFINEINVPIYLGGAIAQNPQKLDGAGQQLDLDEATVFLNYQVFGSVDLNTLNLFPAVPP